MDASIKSCNLLVDFLKIGMMTKNDTKTGPRFITKECDEIVVRCLFSCYCNISISIHRGYGMMLDGEGDTKEIIICRAKQYFDTVTDRSLFRHGTESMDECGGYTT